MPLLKLSESEKVLLNILRVEPELTDEQLTLRLGCSRRTVSNMVSKLSDLNRVTVTKLRYRLGANWVNLRKIEVKENT